MPIEQKAPMILVGPGTGIAPFRGFWYHRLAEMKQRPGIIIYYMLQCKFLINKIEIEINMKYKICRS